MGVRIQPKDIEIPEDDPFRYDLLDRKEPAETLTHLVGSIEGPCVMAIDAAWGNGKSTFLRLWSQHLRSNQFTVVDLNVWETDYAEDPFAVLSLELTDALKQHADESTVENLLEEAIKVGRKLAPGLLRLGLSIAPGGELVASEIGKLIESYKEARDSVQVFRKNLQTMAKKVSEGHDNKPVLIMVDELDRCRPSYAVEFLEVAKHLFSVDRIVFVLAINRAELGHSVKALYGQDFDANGYLKRFIDIDFLLPAPNRDDFIANLVQQVKIDEHFQRSKEIEERHHGPDYINTLLKGILGASTVSLRQISQAVHRIGLVLASLPNTQKTFSLTTIVALIVRTIDEQLYHRFRVGKATDLEVVEVIFPGKENSIQLTEFPRQQFEVIIMLGYSELSGQEPCLVEYYQGVQSEKQANGAFKVYRNHAERVLDHYHLVRQALHQAHGSHGAGFSFVIPRIELFSNELKENPVSDSDTSA